MPKSDHSQPDHPLRETEQAAYYAYREWPVLLVLRLKELAALKVAPSADNVPPNRPLVPLENETHAKS